LLISRLQVIAPDHCHHHIKRSFYINWSKYKLHN
jgi:hypothetical protein